MWVFLSVENGESSYVSEKLLVLFTDFISYQYSFYCVFCLFSFQILLIMSVDSRYETLAQMCEVNLLCLALSHIVQVSLKMG